MVEYVFDSEFVLRKTQLAGTQEADITVLQLVLEMCIDHHKFHSVSYIVSYSPRVDLIIFFNIYVVFLDLSLCVCVVLATQI
jgi:hypothetical protein